MWRKWPFGTSPKSCLLTGLGSVFLRHIALVSYTRVFETVHSIIIRWDIEIIGFIQWLIDCHNYIELMAKNTPQNICFFSGFLFPTKALSYLYSDSHYKPQTIVILGIPLTVRQQFVVKRGPEFNLMGWKVSREIDYHGAVEQSWMIQWNLSVTTTSIIRLITCD